MYRCILVMFVTFIVFSLLQSLPAIAKPYYNSINIIMDITPVATSENGYLVIEYSGVSNKIYQIYIPSDYAIPVLKFIVVLPVGAQLFNVEVSYGCREDIILDKPLMKLPGLKPLIQDIRESVLDQSNGSTIFRNTFTWYKMFIWRGVPYIVLMVNPTIVDGEKLVVYKRVSIEIEYTIERIYQPYSLLTHNILSSIAYYVEPSWISHSVLENSETMLLIITRPMFLSVLEDYIELRRHQGFHVVVKTVEDIVDSGVSGRDIPEKIRNYIYNLYQETSGALKYLLIIGDVSGDTGYPNGPDNIGELEPWEVPTRYFYNPDGTEDYSHTGPYTPSDWYYVTLDTDWDGDGDGIYGEDDDGEDWAPELPVGRLPFRSVGELKSYLDAIVRYNRSFIAKWFLTGAIVFYFNQDGWGDWGIQGDTSSEALWNTLSSSESLMYTKPVRLYEHYPVMTVVDEPSDLNGNLSIGNMVDTLYSEEPDITTWFSHGWPHIAWRVLWSSDDGDGVPESDTELYRRPFLTTPNLTDSYGYVAGVVLAMSCLTAAYDANDDLMGLFGMPDLDCLGEKFVKTTSLWYIGWDRVTFDWLYSWSEQVNPEYWALSSGFIYRTLKYLLSDSSSTKYDIGYSIVSAKTWLGSPYMWESDKKVWWASTLLGDPSQLIGHTNTEITLYNNTDITLVIGEKLELLVRLDDPYNNPLPGETVRLILLNTSEVVYETATNDEGYALLEWTPLEEGLYELVIEHPMTEHTMPYTSDHIHVHVIANKLSIYPGKGPSKLWVTVSGGGFTPNSRVEIYFNNILVSETVSDDSGWIKTCIQVPVLEPGNYTIEAIDINGVKGKGYYNITIPVVKLSSTNISVGSVVNVEANMLGETQYYLILVDNIVVQHVLTNSSGGFNTSIIIPTLKEGAHRLRLVQNTIVYSQIAPIRYEEIVSIDFIVYNGVVLESELLEVRKELLQLINSLEHTMDKTFNEINYTIDLLNHSITVINNYLERLDNNITSINKTLRSYINELYTLVNNIFDRLDHIDNAITFIEENISTLEYGLDELEVSVESGFRELNSSIKQLIKDLGELYTTIDYIEDNVEDLNISLLDRIHNAKEYIRKVNESLTDLYMMINSSVSSLLKNTNKLDNRVDYVSSRVDRVEENVSTIMDKIVSLREDLDKRVGGLESELSVSKSNVSSVAKEVDDLKQQVQTLYSMLLVAMVVVAICIGLALYGLFKK